MTQTCDDRPCNRYYEFKFVFHLHLKEEDLDGLKEITLIINKSD